MKLDSCTQIPLLIGDSSWWLPKNQSFWKLWAEAGQLHSSPGCHIVWTTLRPRRPPQGSSSQATSTVRHSACPWKTIQQAFLREGPCFLQGEAEDSLRFSCSWSTRRHHSPSCTEQGFHQHCWGHVGGRLSVSTPSPLGGSSYWLDTQDSIFKTELGQEALGVNVPWNPISGIRWKC